MVETIRHGHGHEVSVYMGEATLWQLEVLDGRSCVFSHFGPLTLNSLTGPSRDFLFHVRPYEFSPDHLAGPFHSGVTQAMDSFEYALSPGVRHEGSCWTVRDIDVKVGRA